MIKTATLVYCPPPQFPGSTSFLENIKQFPPSGELIPFSDPPAKDGSDPYPHIDTKLKISPEVFKNKFLTTGEPFGGHLEPGQQVNQFSHNNALWMAALAMAVQKGFTHILYVEADCRFGKAGWDNIIFDEYFSKGFPFIAAGTLVCWDPFNDGLETARKWKDCLNSWRLSRWPIATYGFRQNKPCIFPNGALGVYDMSWMQKLFNLSDAMEVIKGHAWDFNLGRRIWNAFGNDSFSMVGHLDSVFSTWGDTLSSQADRLAVVRERRAVAAHQFKGEVSV